MMGCEKNRVRLDDWLDGLLDEEAAGEVRDHLAFCEECRELFESHAHLAEQLAALADQINRIADSTGAVPRRKTWKWTLRAASFAAAAALVLVVMRMQPPVLQPESAGPDRLAVPPRPPSAAPIQLEISSADARIAVPMESQNPRVRILWLYDTLPPADGGPAATQSDMKGV